MTTCTVIVQASVTTFLVIQIKNNVAKGKKKYLNLGVCSACILQHPKKDFVACSQKNQLGKQKV